MAAAGVCMTRFNFAGGVDPTTIVQRVTGKVLYQILTVLRLTLMLIGASGLQFPPVRLCVPPPNACAVIVPL